MRTAYQRIRDVVQEAWINHLLREYSDWLYEHGYLDTDYKFEEPHAVDEYMREQE